MKNAKGQKTAYIYDALGRIKTQADELGIIRCVTVPGTWILGISKSFNEALYKAFLGAGIDLPKHRQIIITVKDADKGEAIEIGRRFEKLGYTIYATRSTATTLKEAGVKARKVNKIHQESPTVMDLLLGHRIDLVIDTPTQGRDKSRDGFLIRRTAIETGVNCLTSLDTANALP